jgi:hypothetical protein
MFKQDNPQEVQEGTYYQDPFRMGGIATLWYYGGYMAYSTKNGDYVSNLKPMSPYKEYERETVVTGYTDQILKRYDAEPSGKMAFDGQTPVVQFNPNGRTIVEKVPITKQVLHDVTPPYVPFGQEIKAGDIVKCAGIGTAFTGHKTLEAINDAWILVDGMYIPWRTNITLQRA